jgi:radical SAM protein with 4Fe4S-binding SPASM domain
MEMKGILRNTGGYFTKSVLKSLLQPTGKQQRTRGEIMLDWLAFGKQTEGDNLCSFYYFFLEYTLSKMSKENKLNKDLVKKVIREYPIFRKMVNKGLLLLLKGIEEYGLTSPQRMIAPLVVEFEITRGCNLLCKHCFASAGSKMKYELDTNEAKHIIDQISEMGTPVICFTGGEPLLRKDFFELLKYTRKKGMGAVLLTNGTLMTKDKAKKLKDAGIDYVRISLDSYKANTHDWLRGVPGTFDETVNGIKNCVEAGIKTGVGSVVIKENQHEVEKLIDLAVELGCCDITTCRLFPLGLGKSFTDRMLTFEEMEEIENLLLKKSEEYINKIFINPLTLSSRRMHGFAKTIADAVGGCPAGISVCAITPDGEIKPCTIFSLKVGDLRKQSFFEIWKTSKVFGELRNRSLLKGKCSKCEFKYSCGGCRATAYGFSGDYLQHDPITCILNGKVRSVNHNEKYS